MSTHPSHPVQNDDFKRIRGIGSGIESRLYNAQIYTYAQLADLTPYELARVLHGLAGLSTERISQQDWIGQARQLADEQIEERTEQAEELAEQDEEWAELSQVPLRSEDMAEEVAEESLALDSLAPQSRNHYVNFTVELWLDEDNDVRRTRVIHVQDRSETAWSGWEGQRLIDFIVERARLFQPVQTTITAQTQIDLPNVRPPQGTESSYHSQLPAATTMGTDLQLKEMKVTTTESPNPTRILTSLQPFHVYLALDLAKITAQPGTLLNYSAKVFAKDLSRGIRLVVGTDQGDLLQTEQADIEIEGNRLPAGIYHLETVVTFSQQSRAAPRTKLMAFLDGGVFQVY